MDLKGGLSFSAKSSPRAPPLGKHPLCILEASHRDAARHPFIFLGQLYNTVEI